MTEFAETMHEFKTEIEDLRQRQTQVAKDGFAAATKTLFEKHGEVLGGFSWPQYTPYFCDGDPCVFNTGEITLWEPDTTEEEAYEFAREESGPYSGYGEDSKTAETIGVYEQVVEQASYGPVTVSRHVRDDENPNFSQAYVDARKDVVAFHQAIPTDVYEALFGDHVEIRVTPEGVDVDDYEHE